MKIQAKAVTLICGLLIIFSSPFSYGSASDNKSVAVPLTTFADIIEPLMPAVVNIYTVKFNEEEGKNGSLPDLFLFEQFNEFFEKYNVPFSLDELYSNPNAMALGSGFIIDESGLIVTNHHVVANADEIHIKLLDNKELEATVVGVDPRTDLALLKVNSSEKLPFVKFGDSALARVGDVVIAIGNPFGLGGTVTSGIISSKSRDLEMDEIVDDYIQIDAAINTGNSGGPLFNIKGEVIGVNSSIAAFGGGTNIGISFAIPSNTVKDIIEQLKKSGKITRGRLDISIQEVTKALAEAFGLEDKKGILVVEVKPGGNGDKAGLKRGDLITEFNGQKVLNSRKLQLFVAETHIGGDAKIKVIRQGKEITINAVILEPEPEAEEEDNDARNTVEKSGVVFSDLSPNLISRFALNDKNAGVLVVDIAPDTALDLRIGDLVLAIEQEYIQNVEQFKNLYEKLKNNGKKSGILLIKRQGLTRFVAISIK